jgi:AcrR family transcriptional regulator
MQQNPIQLLHVMQGVHACENGDMSDILSTFIAGATDSGDAPTDGDSTFHRILDGALHEAAARGLGMLRMEGIARSAQVNRTTLYRRFQGIDGIIAALAAREGLRMRTALQESLGSIDDPADRLVEGFVTAVAYGRAHPLVRRAMEVEPELLIAVGLADNARLLGIGTETIAAEVRRAQQRGLALHLHDPDAAGEMFARILASTMLLPGGLINVQDDTSLRRLARSTLVPMMFGEPRPPST